MAESLIYSVLTDDELLRISNKIREKELHTSGEICLSIKEKRKISDYNRSIKELAQKEFIRIGVDKTEDRTGILIFILLKERQFYIMADEGINSKVEQKVWDELSSKMAESFSHGEFAAGLLECINSIGEVLKEHFPIKPGDRNELTNKVRLIS
jgi:uncharacterized membrane protein